MEAQDILLFGATGDLAKRKLLPAIQKLQNEGRWDSNQRLMGLARADMTDQDFSRLVAVDLPDLAYCSLTSPSGLAKLHQWIRPQVPQIIYLAVPASEYINLCHRLHKDGLIKKNTKIVVEKPIGLDLESARAIDEALAEYFDESRIFRIDHYLGKHTVQNLLALRFSNSIFEHQWNQRYIDNVQITIAETLGVERRAGFYEQSGALRDMMQNHLLQLLCITAMEPPASLDGDSVRDEKVKVLKALKVMSEAEIPQNTLIGQYQEGLCDSKPVLAYRQENNVDRESVTETFGVIKAEIDNWRWSGVPFYLRTGKRLPQRSCEILVQFKKPPKSIFVNPQGDALGNRLIFRLQPDEGISLLLFEKQYKTTNLVQPMTLSLQDEHRPEGDAYERLLEDVVKGDCTRFIRQDEFLAAWQWIDPIVKYWQDRQPEFYASGTWGPNGASRLMAKDGRHWVEE